MLFAVWCLLSAMVAQAATATDCTLYASASGNDNNSGTSPTAPKTFQGAANAAQPGAVVCLMGGTYNLSSTFYPPQSGTPTAWIVYKAYGDSPANLIWTAGATGQPMFKFGSGTFPSGPDYLEFRGFNMDGQNNALDGFFCYGAHHLRFIGNTINNTGGSGVGSVQCDYLTSDHNLINHNGYLYGWTSGISYNTNVFFDSYTGFHNIISNNIVVGEYDSSSHHTDGNGIILDLGGNTPSTLIINNVVYGNGGRCIQSLNNVGFWIINNTCYKNDLDLTLGNVGSFTSQNSSNGYFINNITVAWRSNSPSYDQEGSNSNIAYYSDMYFGASNNFTYSDPSQLIQADPLFVSPPVFDPTALGQYATALSPSQLGNGLSLQSNSPALGKGIDPSALSGVPAAIVTDLKKYIYTDINGTARPQGDGVDLGAYQMSGTPPPPPDTTPPSVPAGLNLTNPTLNSLTMAWTASTDNVAVAGYRLDVSLNAAFSSFVTAFNNKDLGNVTTSLISGLAATTTYYVRLRAYDAAGNVSTNSSVVSGVTATPLPLPSISTFTATPASITTGQSLTLSWIVTGATVLSIDQGVGTVTGMTSTPVSPIVTTLYTLTATNTSGSIMKTVTVTVNAQPPPPPPPPPVSLPTPTLNLPNYLPVNGTLTAGFPMGFTNITFTWTITPATGTPPSGAFGSPGLVISRASAASFQTPSNVAPLAGYSLVPGFYTVQVYASGNGFAPSNVASKNISLVLADLSAVRVYPNPWRSDKHSGKLITFDNLAINSTIKIFTISGHWVKTLPTSSTSATWDLTNDSGDKVASGLYVYLITTDSGQKKTGQVAVIK